MERFWLVSYVLAWGLVLAEGLALIAMLWAIGRIHLQSDSEDKSLITDDGPDLHTPLPEFEGRDGDGHWVTDGDFHGRDFVLLLLSAGCEPCEELLDAVPLVQSTLSRCPEFLIVWESGAPQAAQAGLRPGRFPCPFVMDPPGAVRTALNVSRTPFGFLVDRDGIVRMKGVVNNQKQLEGLISRRGRSMGALTWESLPRQSAAGYT